MATQHDIRIPVESLHALRRSLARELGAEEVARAFTEAGHAAGDALTDRLGRVLQADDPGDMPSGTFWDRLGTLFRELGWGSVRHEEIHPGVGALTMREWFEVDSGARTTRCPFTTGVVANILGRVAGRAVAVMQVPCPDAEPGCARFVFGSASVLNDLYADLREGRELDTALAALG